MRKLKTGGGWRAILYTFKKGREAGGIWKLWKAMRTRNACKTCALGMGGQKGGMVNEAGHFPEVCKKSLQAMVADMQGAIQPEFWSKYSAGQLKQFSPYEMEHCGRITQPVLREPGSDHFRPISWEEAVSRIVAKLKAIQPDESFWYFSGRSSNEAGFLLQLFARLYGTNNVNNCSFYCHQASGVGLMNTLGSGAGTVQLEDIDHADLVFVIGGNPASNHPRLMRSLMTVRRRGGQVIVINPVVETGLVNFSVPSDPISLLFGTKIASLYVQPHIGGDLALMMGIAKRILEMNAVDREFLANHTEGWPELSQRLDSLEWDEVVAKSGVSKAEIDDIATRYAAARSVVFAWTMGITHHTHGVDNVHSIANLALMRGMVGRPHTGLLPIRGHSNVQGIGTVGVTPKLKDAIFNALESHYGVKLPKQAGLDTMACMEAADEGRLKFGFCLGGNLFGSNPDANYAQRALGKLDLLVYLNTTLNTGHAWGLGKETIILPALARDEEPEATTQESMFSYVRVSDGGEARHVGPRSEIHVIADLAHRVLGDSTPIDWQAMSSAAAIRASIAATVPGLEEIERAGETKKEFQIPGRTFHTPVFPTATGKAQIRTPALIPDLAGVTPEQGGNQLRLMTVRTEGQFNTVVYEETDIYRNQDRRDVILMHPDDLRRLGLKHDQRVVVRNSTGSLPGILARGFEEIRSGNCLMYYPEANVLVPRNLDPQSKTPAFKNVLVEVVASEAPPRDIVPSETLQLVAADSRGSLKSC